ncbi:MAG: hypothetical protein D3914_03115 [Candidatus Electrothrix sp. LOE2]|nr:hypothetical protein [Candidatus Electrothrix sp. LOE2]
MFLMIHGGRNHNYVLSFLSCRGGTPVFAFCFRLLFSPFLYRTIYRTDTGNCSRQPLTANRGFAFCKINDFT